MADILLQATVTVNISRWVYVDSIDDVRAAVKEFEKDSYFAIRLEREAGEIEVEVDEGADEYGIGIDEGTGYTYDNVEEYIAEINDDPDHELHGTDDSEADDDDDDSDDDDDDLVEKPVDAVDAPTPEAVNDVDSDDESPIANASEAAPTAPTMVVSKPKFASRRNHRSFTAKVKSVFNRIARRF